MNVIIDFLTNRKIETAITIIVGLAAIGGYIFSGKIRAIIDVFVKFLIRILEFIAPYGIVNFIKNGRKIVKLRNKCLEEIERAVGYDYYSESYVIRSYIFAELSNDKLLQHGTIVKDHHKELIKIIKNAINKGRYDKKLKEMERKDFL